MSVRNVIKGNAEDFAERLRTLGNQPLPGEHGGCHGALRLAINIHTSL